MARALPLAGLVRLFAALLPACTFEPGAAPDASSGDDAAGSLPDGNGIACTPGFVDLCTEPAPSSPLDLPGPDLINTDTDPRCRTLHQANGSDVCLVYATSVDIGTGGSLTATGSRPLAIAATSTMSISGLIDVSSQRVTGQRGPAADDKSCAVMSPAEPDDGGAGGGAGASFGHTGGNGGSGDTDLDTTGDSTAAGGRSGAIANVVALRGGCVGDAGGNVPGTGAQGGAGGHSGGGLYLFAHDRIDIPGRIRATGAGGEGGKIMSTGSGGGGGGGGSGGLVVIESPMIAIGGQISANGGGAGEGGFLGGTPRNGQPGADGSYGTMQAAGGRTNNYTGTGFGGAGGAGTAAASGGGSSVAGGGGGGGGVGTVKLIGAPSIVGTVSPPPS